VKLSEGSARVEASRRKRNKFRKRTCFRKRQRWSFPKEAKQVQKAKEANLFLKEASPLAASLGKRQRWSFLGKDGASIRHPL